MTTLFLYTFFVGFSLTLISALLGAVHLGGQAGSHGGDLGHGAHAGDLGHGDGGAHGDTASVSPVNFQTLVAFLMGFGGMGYLIALLTPALLALALLLAIAGGIGTSWLIYHWLRFLVRGERPMEPTAYVGLVGRLTLGIREGGTGEIIYTVAGTRTVLAARSVEGTAIPKGEQVVVLRYEKGIAYVQPLHEPEIGGGNR
jgi:hypothetical protein